LQDILLSRKGTLKTWFQIATIFSGRANRKAFKSSISRSSPGQEGHTWFMHHKGKPPLPPPGLTSSPRPTVKRNLSAGVFSG